MRQGRNLFGGVGSNPTLVTLPKSQSAGLEPARAEPSGFLVHPLNRLGTTAVGEKMDTEGFEPSTSRMRNGRSSTELSALHSGAALLCDRTQVVTGLDLKSSGLCPRRFEPCRSRLQMYEQPGSNRRSHACEACVLTTRRCSLCKQFNLAAKVEMQGIDPCTSRMLSERSTI